MAVGGCFVAFPLLSFFYLLDEGRLSSAYAGAFSGIMLFVMFVLFAGLFVAAVGLQMILEDSHRNT
jgi:hypothetical protein